VDSDITLEAGSVTIEKSWS